MDCKQESSTASNKLQLSVKELLPFWDWDRRAQMITPTGRQDPGMSPASGFQGREPFCLKHFAIFLWTRQRIHNSWKFSFRILQSHCADLQCLSCPSPVWEGFVQFKTDGVQFQRHLLRQLCPRTKEGTFVSERDMPKREFLLQTVSCSWKLHRLSPQTDALPGLSSGKSRQP